MSLLESSLLTVRRQLKFSSEIKSYDILNIEMLNNNSLLEMRSEYLTIIFKYAPYLASDYFYVVIIALGYWLKPSCKIFRSLGFLVPFSTLLNCSLKNFFQILRPDISLHLVPVHDPFGFPSGDVQVATIFWGLISTLTANNSIKILCVIPVIFVAISRVYLGIHSLLDVAGALFIGVFTLYAWNKYSKSKFPQNVQILSHQEYWSVFLGMIILYAIISMNLNWPPMVFMSMGALIGYGSSLKMINNSQFHHKTRWI